MKMDSFTEQRVVIKLCVTLNKTVSETFDMLHTAYRDDTLSRSRTFEWHRRFKAGREVTEDVQWDENHQRLGKTSKDHKLSKKESSQTEDWQLERLPVISAWNLEQYKAFWLRTVGWGGLVPSSLRSCCQMNRGFPVFKSAWPAGSLQKGSKFYSEHHYGWQKPGVWIWSRNKGSKLPMEVNDLSSPQTSQDEQVECEDHADCFLRLWRSCPSWIRPTKTDCH